MDFPIRPKVFKFLNTNSKVSIVVVFPEETSVLAMEIAGRSAGDYLLHSLSECRDAEVSIAVNDEGLSAILIEKFPNFSKYLASELHCARENDQGRLFIDARAWLSQSSLAELLSRTRITTGNFRVVAVKANAITGQREGLTLAIYLAPGQRHDERSVPVHGRCNQSDIRALLSQAFPNETIVTCTELDPAQTAFLVVSLIDLAEQERRILLMRANAAMIQGVRIHDPSCTYIRGDLVCGEGVVIDTNVIVEGNVVLGSNVKIGANTILRNCRIGDSTIINPYSIVDQSSVGSGSFVGPYGRVRPGSVIGDNVQIGNYVEIKNSQIGNRSRINHHTFIGDALLSDGVTIGAGTITCNHDGLGTNQTVIGRDAYIGSGCNLVAPLHIGAQAIVGAGSTITRDVPPEKLTVARQKQMTVEGWKGPKSRRGK